MPASKDTSAEPGLSLHIVGASQVVAENQAHLLGWLEGGHLEDHASP